MKSSLKELLFPPYLPEHLVELEEYIHAKESAFSLKEDNQARIEWNNPEKPIRTEYSVVYIHGFSSSHGDGLPLHREIAHYLEANLFLCRLAGHGYTEKPFYQTRYQDWFRSATEAIEVGKRIGKRVVVMGCSTGATLAAVIAAYDPSISALMLYSPLVEFYERFLRLLPTSVFSLISTVLIPKFQVHTRAKDKSLESFERKYWYSSYPIQIVTELKKVVDIFKKEKPFIQIRMPLLLAYYHKNKLETDKRVSIPALKAIKEAHIYEGKNRLIRNYRNSGNHILTNPQHNHTYQTLLDDSMEFLSKLVK